MSLTKKKLFIPNPFDLEYSTKTSELTLIHVEASTACSHEIRFSAQAIRALFDLLVAAARCNGGTLGIDYEAAARH